MRIPLGWLTAFMAVVLVSSVCRAQRLLDEAGPLVTPLNARAVEEFSRTLALDADQRALVRTLYQGYRAALKQADAEAGQKAQSLTEDTRRQNEAVAVTPEQYRKTQRARMELLHALIDQADALEAAFFDDLGALLTPEQAARLPAVQRARHRDTGVRFALVSGEGVDLVRILDELKIDRTGAAGLVEAVAQYETDADKLFEAKKSMFRRIFKRVSELEADGDGPDPKAMNEVVTEVFEHGARLRDINRRAARRIGGELPESTRAAFEREVQKRSFPRVYAPSAAAKALDAIAKFDDLTPDQSAQLAEIRASFDREVGPLNDRWAAAQEAAESLIPGRFGEIMANHGEMPGIEPLREACRARADLEERIKSRVQPLLTPAQRTRVEELHIDKTDFDPDFMPDFGDDDTWDEWDKEDGGG